MYIYVTCTFFFQKPHSNAEPYFITTANKEQYKCLIPDAPEQEHEYSESYNGPNPIQLLQSVFAQTGCSYRVCVCTFLYNFLFFWFIASFLLLNILCIV